MSNSSFEFGLTLVPCLINKDGKCSIQRLPREAIRRPKGWVKACSQGSRSLCKKCKYHETAMMPSYGKNKPLGETLECEMTCTEREASEH